MGIESKKSESYELEGKTYLKEGTDDLRDLLPTGMGEDKTPIARKLEKSYNL